MSDYLPGRSANSLPSFNRPQTWGGPGPVDFDFHAMAHQLDCSRNFSQAGIIYSNGVNEWLVRPSRRIATPNQSTVSHVIVTKVGDTSQDSSSKAIAKTLQSPSLATEITSTALSCGAAAVTLMLHFTAAAAIPMTAGTSLFVSAIINTGTVATVAQCLIGAGRLITISRGGEENIAWLDSQDWYLATSTALDVLSLAGAGVGLARALKIWQTMKKASSAEAMNWLKGLDRAERKRLTYEIIRNKNPGISNSGIKALIEMGSYPNRFPSEALQRTLQMELLRLLESSAAYVGSSISGTIRNPQNVKKSGQYVVGIIQSFSTR